MVARKPLIGISLKMYMGVHRSRAWLAELARLAETGLPAGVDVFVIPSFLSLHDAQASLQGTGIWLGAQDVFWEDAGAFTGEVSAPMLVEAGCRYVEIGHIERRRLFGETETVVAAKMRAAVRAGLVPVLCIGENERMSPEAAVQVCARQLDTATAGIDRSAGLVVAWEPVWAVGAAEPAAPDYIAAVATGLRELLTDWPDGRLIYGGSAGPGLLTQLGGTVDGLFLGRFAHDIAALHRVLVEASGTISS